VKVFLNISKNFEVVQYNTTNNTLERNVAV